jgi:hypothetical protein
MKMRTALIIFLCLLFSIPAFADDLVFKRIKYFETKGEKTLKHEAMLTIGADAFKLTDRKGNLEYALIPYDAVDKIVYEKSAHPRWKTAVFLTMFALLSKGKKHWLTITWKEKEEGDYVILRMHKDDYRAIVTACESRTGKEVEWIQEK